MLTKIKNLCLGCPDYKDGACYEVVYDGCGCSIEKVYQVSIKVQAETAWEIVDFLSHKLTEDIDSDNNTVELIRGMVRTINHIRIALIAQGILRPEAEKVEHTSFTSQSPCIFCDHKIICGQKPERCKSLSNWLLDKPDHIDANKKIEPLPDMEAKKFADEYEQSLKKELE